MNSEQKRRELETHNFDYALPEEAIAMFPLKERDKSKLLRYDRGRIDHHVFHALPELLPENSLLIFNNTKVVPARLHFQKPTGAWIELLIIEQKIDDHQLLKMNQRVCQCMIGNRKKWHSGEVLLLQKLVGEDHLELEASWHDAECNLVLLTWKPEKLSFYEILAQLGEMPIPPYLNRESDESDKVNYQTVYARKEGAIAAPTAGLHFTASVLNKLKDRNIATSEITLHVGLGTFKPMKSERVADHEMHKEEVVFQIETISQLIQNEDSIIAVGTTSLRSLESVYWIGTALLDTGILPAELQTEEPYLWQSTGYSRSLILKTILSHMLTFQLPEIRFSTRIYIMPGYQFRMVDGLITNFHQPKSTLLVLISAFVGDDWKRIYSEALENQYRFLSYGDSSILIN